MSIAPAGLFAPSLRCLDALFPVPCGIFVPRSAPSLPSLFIGLVDHSLMLLWRAWDEVIFIAHYMDSTGQTGQRFRDSKVKHGLSRWVALRKTHAKTPPPTRLRPPQTQPKRSGECSFARQQPQNQERREGDRGGEDLNGDFHHAASNKIALRFGCLNFLRACASI